MSRRMVIKGILILFLASGFWCVASLPSKDSTTITTGSFIVVGGGNIPTELKKEFVRLSSGRIVVITNASERPETWNEYEKMWKDCKAKTIYLYRSPKDLDFVHGVWISGGDQRRLNGLLQKDRLVSKLKRILRNGGVVGGTSAGASILGDIMPFENEEEYGYQLIEKVIFDQHFTQRNRYDRLKRIVGRHEGFVGYGIDEDTGILLTEDGWKVYGAGRLTVVRN